MMFVTEQYIIMTFIEIGHNFFRFDGLSSVHVQQHNANWQTPVLIVPHMINRCYPIIHEVNQSPRAVSRLIASASEIHIVFYYIGLYW